MIRAIFAAVLLVTLVSAGPGEYKKKIFMKYAMNNMFAKCIGQQAMDKFVLDYIKAAQRCYPREFNVTLKPVYIRPYPVEGYNNYNNRGNFQQNYNNQPFQQYQQQQYQQFQQQPQYQQFQQQPQYNQQYRQPQFQGQQYRQQQQNFGNQQPQPFYAPGVGFQPVNNNQVLNRQVRQANKKNNKNQNNKQKQVVAGTNAQGEGEAELYYYNKLKDHMTGKVGNFSCIMHEMGYFTEDNQVNIAKYKQAYNELTNIPAAMREEFIEAIDLCQEVSECLPEKCFAKYPYGPEYGRSFFFVMCEKKKALEVCLKKQMIDDYYKYKDIIGEDQIHDDLENTEDMFGMGF